MYIVVGEKSFPATKLSTPPAGWIYSITTQTHTHTHHNVLLADELISVSCTLMLLLHAVSKKTSEISVQVFTGFLSPTALNTGRPLFRHCEIPQHFRHCEKPRHFPDSLRHSHPCRGYSHHPCIIAMAISTSKVSVHILQKC